MQRRSSPPRSVLVSLVLIGCSSGSTGPADATLSDAIALDTTAREDVQSDTAPDARVPFVPCPRGTYEGPDGGTRMSGVALNFGPGPWRLEGAEVTVAEDPARCVRTDGDGAFAFTGFVPGTRATFEMRLPGWAPIRTGTFDVGTSDVSRITFQAPNDAIYRIMALSIGITPDPSRCQLATTVTTRGLSVFDPVPSHGEAGATVTIEPPLPAELGPFYFEYYGPGAIAPVRTRTDTSRDGGVVFLNVPAGEYVLRASKPGVTFTPIRLRCVPGYLVNASPPYGIQML